MKEFFYSFLVPTSIAVGGWYQDDIKKYFKNFKFRKNWTDVAMAIITFCIFIMTIAIVEYKP